MSGRKIDAVICWVDGNDPVLKEKRAKYMTEAQASRDDVAGATRYDSQNEIAYCICSILRNAPFINCIFIITDGQVPPLDDVLKRNFPENRIPIKIIDHKIIFRDYEDVLPTFNSGALETMMWRIPGLSDYFIYLNDDFAITAPLTEDDFFNGDKAVVHGYWHSTFTARLHKWLKGSKKIHFRDGMLKSAELLGARRFVRIPHIPRLYHRQVQERFYAEHPDEFRRNMSYRFRVPGRLDNNSLVATIMAMQEGAEVRHVKDDVLYLEPRKTEERFREEFDRCKRLTGAKFLCTNSLDKFSPEQRKEIQDWLAARLNIIV